MADTDPMEEGHPEETPTAEEGAKSPYLANCEETAREVQEKHPGKQEGVAVARCPTGMSLYGDVSDKRMKAMGDLPKAEASRFGRAELQALLEPDPELPNTGVVISLEAPVRVRISDLLVVLGLAKSGNAARRLIAGGAVRCGNVKVTDELAELTLRPVDGCRRDKEENDGEVRAVEDGQA